MTAALVPLLLPVTAQAAAPMAAPSAEETIGFCEQGVQCPIVSQAYLEGTKRGQARDSEIMTIVATLAETANTPVVPLAICREAAEGMLVLSEGLVDVSLKDQAVSIAQTMCQDTATAAIGEDAGNSGTSGGNAGSDGGGTGGGDGGDNGGGDGGGTGGGDGGGDGGGTGGGDGGGTGGGNGNGVGGTGQNRSGGADGTNPGGGGNSSGFGNPGKGKNH